MGVSMKVLGVLGGGQGAGGYEGKKPGEHQLVKLNGNTGGHLHGGPEGQEEAAPLSNSWALESQG